MSADRGRAWNVGAAGPALRLIARDRDTGARWQDFAACREYEPDLWYAGDPANSADYAEARAVCAGCPVRSMCLEYALERESGDSAFGVWGGLSPRERRNLRRQRRKQAA